jgi:hypothetical protein
MTAKQTKPNGLGGSNKTEQGATLTADGIADVVLSKSADKHVLVGPLVYQPSDGTTAKAWYVIVCTGDKRKQFHCDQIFCPDAATREALIVALLRPGILVQDMSDELEMARWGEAIWPGEKPTRISERLERERAAA